MVLNLFLAILLNFISDNLGNDDSGDKDSDKGDKEKENELVEEEFQYIQEKHKLKANSTLQLQSQKVSNITL
jgi:hypothetical protein